MAEHRRSRAKVPNPYPFEEKDATVQSLKKWFNVISNHQKQNDEFLIFFEGEERENWTAKKIDPTRGVVVQQRAADIANGIEAINADQAATMSRRIRRDLDTLLNTFATYVPEAFYDTIVEEATSIKWIHDRLALYCKLGSNKQFVLNSYTIKYDPDNGDTPEKLYLKLKAHYSNAAPKANSKFDGQNVDNDVAVNELCELMLVEMTLVKIDSRLPAHIQATRAHLMQDDKTLYCVRRVLWDQVDQMIAEINDKDDLSSSIRLLNSKNQGAARNNSGFNMRRNSGNNFKKQVQFNDNGQNKTRGKSDKFCSACFRASKPENVYRSHDMTSCNFLSSDDKRRVFKAAARLLKAEDENSEVSDMTNKEEGEDNSDSDTT